jgi:hypothetical protein
MGKALVLLWLRGWSLSSHRFAGCPYLTNSKGQSPSWEANNPSLLILSSYLPLDRCLLSSGLWKKKGLYELFIDPMRPTCPGHLILSDLLKNKIYEAPHYPLFSILFLLRLFGRNILSSTLVSNTMPGGIQFVYSLCRFVSVLIYGFRLSCFFWIVFKTVTSV